MQDSETDFRTISEVATALNVPQHVLRFWETQFAQVKPTKRRGNRRFYSGKDFETLERIRGLLYTNGYTIKGARKALNQHFIPGDDYDMRKKKEKDAKQIDIFEVIAQPTFDEKAALRKVLDTLKQMELLMRNGT